MDINDILKQVKSVTDNNKSESEKKTLTSLDFTPNSGGILGVAREGASRAYSVDADLARKYNKYGLTWNPREYYNGSLDVQLADTQSNWTKFGNALAQTVVSEIGLGTLLGISDLFDAVGQAVGLSDHDYQNPVSRKLEEWQEAFTNEVAPIYSRPGSGFENGTDFGWWMQNIPSIASSLTLLIPAAGTTKLLSMAGRAAVKGTRAGVKWLRNANKLENLERANRGIHLSSKTIETGKLFAKNATTAALSRTMENFQESRQVYNDMYTDVAQRITNMDNDEYQTFIEGNQQALEGVDVTDKDEVAKAVARKAADTTFKMDYANTVFDIIQLYALRNVAFHGFRNTKPSAAARRLDKNARRFAGKYTTMGELEELVAKQSLKRKAADKVGDFLYTGRTVFAAEASEGIEEAVNYIAQQEGMHVGKTMLGMEANTTFSDRLKQYMKAPELWESAFWGLAGGIVFQGAGSGLNRVSTAIERKNEVKKKQANTQTGENPSANTSWTALWEQGDVKRVKTSIENRLAIENNYQQIVNQINNGENPFVRGEKVESQEEKELLIRRAMENRRTAMVLNAMDSGTIGMLRGYLEDNNVKQALIDKGIVTKEQADRVQQEDIAAIDKIQEMYDRNVRTLNAASRNIRMKNGTHIPTEYLQIIARNNIEAQLAVQDYEAQLASWEGEANDLEQQFRDKLDPNVDHKEIIRLNWLTRKLGELEAEKRELKKNKEAVNSVSGQERLRTLDNNINNIRQMVADLNPDNKLANLLYAIENSFSYEKTRDGKYEAIGANKDYLEFRNAVVNKDYNYFKNLDERLVDISEEDFGAQQVLDDNVRRSLSTRVTSSINNVSQELGSAYATLAALQYQIAAERSNIKQTQQDIEQEVGYLHNYMNEVRKQKIKDATEQIKGLADKYGADEIKNYLRRRYNNQTTYMPDNMSEQDEDMLKEAFDTLNLEDHINSNIAEALDTILENWDDIKAAQDAAREGEAGELSSTSENVISEPQNLEPNNIPQQQQNPVSSQETGQNGDITPETQPTQPQMPTLTNSGLNVNNIGDEKSVSSGMAAIVGVPSYTYHATENPDNFEVTFNTADAENAKHLNNPDLFTQQEGVSLIDNNYIVAKNPIIDRQGNVVEKGYLALNNDENNEELAEIEASIPLTGEEESSSSPITSPERVAETQQEETATAQVDVAQIPYDENDITTRANDAVFNEIKNARLKGSDVIDWNALQERLNKELQQEGTISDYISKEIARAIEHGKKLANRKGIKSVDAVIETIIRSSAIREGLPKDAPARKEFTNAVVELLKVFNDEVGYETINGKKYINVEALCRYCDRVLDDKVSAKLLADNLVDYVKQNSDLIYTDGNINTVKERLETSLDGSNLRQQVIGIDYNTLLRDLTKTKSFKELEAFYDIIDNIQPGDNVQTVVGDKGIVFKVNNTTIGTLPFPKPYKNGGVYQYNDGWRTDILEHNGVIESDLRDLFIRWATDMNNSDIKELNDIITQYAYRKQNNADIATLVKAFENNKEVKQAIAKGFIVQNADTEKLLNGIAKIWQYTRANANDTQEEIADKRSADIAQWFEDKVAPSFKFIDYLRYNKNAVVEINSISEGRQIETPKEQALPVSKAIGSNYKGKVRIGVVEKTGVITLAGNGIDGATHLSFGASRGNTFIIIPARNGNHAYIHAFPQSVNSNTLSQTAKRIKNNIYAEIERICHSSDTTTREQVQELEDFIKDLLSDYNGLFVYRAGTILNVADNHFQNGGKNGFTVWHRAEGENKAQPLNINIKSDMKDIAAQLQKIFDDCAAFNIHFGSVNSDRGGISSQRMTKRGANGEFIISIPNQEEFTFASYNDFVIENDLVLATTKPTEDGKSNFERLTDNNETTQNITVKLGAETSTPVREMNEDSQTPTIEPTPEANVITSIFSNKRIKNKAVKVAEIILGENIVKQITFNGKKFNMFPKSVIFVDENIIDNATTNIGDKEIIHPNNKNVTIPAKTVVVGKEWLAMATSENETDRKEAVKKLIHEQLHLIIHDGNTQYIEQIREIFDEFAAKNTIEVLNKYLYKWDEARYYKDGKITEEGLEEFLVESLTSNELAEGLNAIEATSDNNTDKKKSLFQKIMEVITKMLGIYIKKGSLYEKEFKLLRDVLSTPTQTEINFGETTTETEEVVEDINPLIEDDDFDIYRSSTLNEESTITSYSSEMQQIKDKAIANGTFMKAPNGNPSNLTERQWLQVRTKAFKDWFGDWERLALTKLQVNRNLKAASNTVSVEEYFDYLDKYIIEQQEFPKGKEAKFKTLELYTNWANQFYRRADEITGLKNVLKRLLQNVDTSFIKIHQGAFAGENGDYGEISGLAYDATGDIFVKDYYSVSIPSLYIEVVAHEIIHQITTHKYNNDINFRHEVDDLFSYIKTQLPNSKLYGLSSPTEMLAEIANPNFQKALLNIPSRNNKQSIFKDIIELLKKVFNIANDNSVLEELLDLINKNAETSDNSVSKVVDENGEPLVVYHHRKSELNDFSKRTDNVFPGIYFSKTPFTWFGPVQIAAFLNIKNPAYDYKSDTLNNDQIEDYKYLGNDGVFGTDFEDETNTKILEYVAFDANQIKSATDNIGTFSRENNNIRSSTLNEKYVPNIAAFIDTFPVQQQAKIREQIENGEISISCK